MPCGDKVDAFAITGFFAPGWARESIMRNTTEAVAAAGENETINHVARFADGTIFKADLSNHIERGIDANGEYRSVFHLESFGWVLVTGCQEWGAEHRAEQIEEDTALLIAVKRHLSPAFAKPVLKRLRTPGFCVRVETKTKNMITETAAKFGFTKAELLRRAVSHFVAKGTHLLEAQ